jgi:hypothetical protein
MGGRPTLLTEELADELVLLLAGGLSVSATARAAGVSRRSLTRWMPRLRPLVEQARAAGPATGSALDEVRLSLLILRGGDWRASAWWLETHYPERYGLTEERDPVRPDPDWP